MIDITAKLSAESFSDVRLAYIARARLESGRISDVRRWMVETGHEEVEVPDGQILTGDGREVLRAHGRTWALRPEVHTERLAKALSSSQGRTSASHQAPTKSIVGSESLSALTCPECGDALQHAAVCPACAAGKLGYRHRYTCVCGGVDIVSTEAL
jgi:rubrerythrin